MELSSAVQGTSREKNDLVRLAAFLLTLLVGYLVAGVVEAHGFANWAGPLAFAAGCLWTAYRVVADDAINIWTPFPWFLGASVAFFGIGPLIYPFGSEKALAELDECWTLSGEELWRTNVLNTAATLLVTVVYLVACPLVRGPIPPPARRQNLDSADAEATRAALLFLALGVPFHYFVALPYEFGMLRVVLPGIVDGLDQFVTLALLMLSYLATRRGKGWTAAFVTLFLLEIAVEFVRFHKSALILVFLMAVLGRYLAKRRLGELVVSAVCLAAVYVLVSPFVSAGRLEIVRKTGSHNEASLGERFDIVGQLLTSRSSEESPENEGTQSGWQRLCYAGPQAFAMRRYDEGLPGDSFALAAYVLMPRFLDPDKPIITDVGFDFTELALGFRSSTTGIGIYGEAYWNGGWLTVGLACFVVGVQFALCAPLAVYTISRPNWLMLPCVFFGIKLGFRIDGWFVGDYLGAAALGLVYGAAALLITRRRPRNVPTVIRPARA